jgi:hypothetical protein
MPKRKNKPPRSSRASEQRLVIGVTWYTEQEWAKVRAAAVDPERFEATYSEWLTMAEETFAEMLARGIFAEKCSIKSDELLAWCLAHNMPNNAAARAAYVSEVERASHESGGA